jgi:hypothetical protein
MQRTLVTSALVSSIALTMACGADIGVEGRDVDADAAAAVTTGNGAPSGPHFNLNLIGKAKTQSATITTGNRIFVNLEGRTTIGLAEGADFAVLDGNGTDGRAQFQLPNPDPDGDGVTSFSVFARALGKPGGSGSITTCATDPLTGEEVCSLESAVLVRESGRQRFSDVSRELLFIFADLDGDGVTERLSLFDDRLEGFVWQLDNNGLRLVQLRFYEIPSTAGL